MFFSALSQFTGDKSQNGRFPRHKYPFMNDPYLWTAVPPLPVHLLNTTIVKNLRTLEEQVDF